LFSFFFFIESKSSKHAMASLFQSSSLRNPRFETAVWAAKLLLLFMGIISIFMMFKVSIVPFTVNLSASTLPRLWISLRSWLSPPYIYIIVNFIIITIVASSTFQHPNHHHSSSSPTNAKPVAAATAADQSHNEDEINSSEDPPANSNAIPATTNIDDSHETIWDDIIQQHEERLVEDTNLPNASPETSPGEKGDVEDEDDSLDATWNAIMEAQGRPVTRQLKKSDTWDVPPRVGIIEAAEKNDGVGGDDGDPVAWDRRELRKADTFNDRGSLKRMDKSMSQDELKQRTEAFIKKINYKMRLERLESEQRLMQTVNGGV
jgi:hypothetical protein